MHLVHTTTNDAWMFILGNDMSSNGSTTTTPRIKTFRQYVEEERRDAAGRYDITLAEAARELPEHRYVNEWRDYVVKTFNEGSNIPTALWRSLDEGLQYRVLRSTRALRDNTLTGQLIRKTVPE